MAQHLSPQERVKIVAGFLLSSPPGEFNDVFNEKRRAHQHPLDVRVLINDDQNLQKEILSTFREYNTEQFVSVQMPAEKYEVIISKYGEIDSNRYIDPRSEKSFYFDHLRQVASNPESTKVQSSLTSQRSSIDASIQRYVGDHFPSGLSTVYAKDKQIIILIVDNKYNPSNFWNGRWRSQWIFTPSSNELKGTLRLQVHYYEDGNVQLNSTKEVSTTLSAAESNDSESIIKHICKAEDDYQKAINESYAQLSDTTFKALRRALPITRNKIDWSKVVGYKIGNELNASRGP